MFAIPGLVGLLTFIYLRPQEVFEALAGMNFAGVALAVVVGMVLDWRLAYARPRLSLLVVLAGIFFSWALVTTVVKPSGDPGLTLAVTAGSVLSFLFISQSLQSLHALEAVMKVVLAISLLLALICIRQGLSPTRCILRSGAADIGFGNVVTDGRLCNVVDDCARDSPDPDAEYFCEHVGLLGTSSIVGRVRYRGIVQDPNELAWVLSLAVPIGFTLYERKRTGLRLLLALGGLAAIMTCVVMTKSRSGQLSLLTVLGAYFIRKYRWRGAIGGAILALPLLALGGRSGAEAESSSVERLECWQAGLDMWKGAPLSGVGYRNFGEHHYLTAHNSFILTLAELGPFGLLMWTLVLYAAIKMLISAVREFSGRPEAEAAARWGMALLAGMLGTVVSAFFLSIAYHGLLWLYLGFVVAYYMAVRRHQPAWKVRFRLRDVVLVGTFDLALIASIAFYIKMRGV